MPHPLRPRAAMSCLFAVLMGVGLSVSSPAWAADPVFPPALRVGIVAPPGFVQSPNFPGFQHSEKQASIVMAELPGYAFENIEKEIANELQKNPQAVDRRPIELKDGARGFLLKGTENGPQGSIFKWTLVATAHNVTALVTALVPEQVQDVAPEPAILASFGTLTIRAAVPLEEQLRVLPFTMRELAGFRILRVQPGAAAMLTDGPKDVIESAEQPIMLVSYGQAGNLPPQAERDGFARRLIGETPGLKDMKIVRSEPLRMANQQGHELVLEAKDAKTGVDIQAVQWLRFGSNSLLRIFGLARKDGWDPTFRRFRQVRDGIGPR
jgi:hypothetical protein